MYSVENLQLESFRDLKMFVCECLPFFTGHRMCPAKEFAMTMLKTVVITFVERVKIKTVRNQVINGTYIEVTPHFV